MPPLGRSRPSVGTPRSVQGTIKLPDYEPLAHPLNQQGQDALTDLPRTHRLETLRNRLKTANDHLTDAAAEINDRLHLQIERQEKAKKRRENESSQATNEGDDDALQSVKEKTDDLTAQLDQKVRDIIDVRVEVSNVENALRDLDTNANSHQGASAPTQSSWAASQVRSSKRQRLRDGDEENAEDEDPTAGDFAGLNETLKRKTTESKRAYEASSLFDKYSAHNDYVGFKRILHDAKHPDENAPPLPHASTWFGGETRSNESASFAMGAPQQEDDDDFEVAAENISIKCPITLQVMKWPVQSTKCPHNFEKTAILEMIGLSTTRTGGEGRRNAGEKAIQCPICEILLTKNDFQPNVVLLRKIKRMQDAEDRQNEESDNEDGDARDNQQEVTSSPPPTARSVKRERRSQARRGPSMIPSTQIDSLD